MGCTAGVQLSAEKIMIVLYSKASRPALGPTQPLIYWIPRALSSGICGKGVKLTTHLHIVPR
jgi:hypothetical protein